MNNDLLTPLILCGGAGTRLWPLSRENFPKQFVPLVGVRTSFQETVLRVRDPSLFAPPVVITNERYTSIVAAQLEDIGADATVLIEPMRRDSGPAIGAAAAFLSARGQDAAILVLPSDHVVQDEAAFRAAARRALVGAQAGFIVTFGIEPDHPSTGYGYIRPQDNEVAPGLRKVAQFAEKPDAETARRYVAEGYLWNAGNFTFRADVLIAEYEARDAATMNAASAAAARAEARPHGIMLDREAFEKCRPQSIDYAVMEASSRVAVIPVSMGWYDVGTWQAVWELSEKDELGNAGQGDVVFIDARNNLVRSLTQLVCVVGLEGIGVIATDDAILVYDRAKDSSIKEVISVLQASKHPAGREPSAKRRR